MFLKTILLAQFQL